MYTAIAQTQNINIEASSLLFRQQARRRDLINIISYLHFYIVTNTSTIYTEVNIISSLHYSYFLNEFSDIITIKVLAVGIPHAKLPPNKIKTALGAKIAQERGKSAERTAGYSNDDDVLRREFGIDLEPKVSESARGSRADLEDACSSQLCLENLRMRRRRLAKVTERTWGIVLKLHYDHNIMYAW